MEASWYAHGTHTCGVIALRGDDADRVPVPMVESAPASVLLCVSRPDKKGH
jgi:hypothetical protein